MKSKTNLRTTLILVAVLAGWMCMTDSLVGKEFHVSVAGEDANVGTLEKPLPTIQAAADRAMPGDVITVHGGVYRERINPPRGGTSDAERITYQAAPGEEVVVKGSEVVKGWEKVQNDTWKITLPDSYFGTFNPYKELIHGDWFNPMGRPHHTGAVYLDRHWLTETASLEDVLKPASENPLWYTTHVGHVGNYLVNVTWIAPGDGKDAGRRIAVENIEEQHGVQTADSSEGGKCIGWIESGDWVRYKNVDFGQGTETLAIRSATPGAGGRIEVRLDRADGELLGTAVVTKTGDWQKYGTFLAKIEPTTGKKTICLVFKSKNPDSTDTTTTIWAQLPGVDPNKDGIEINTRQAVFYPEKTGINYITVRGFTLEHASPNWAPPTAEQVGLIGTHWSKGWVIENNTIRYSICTGVTLGKHGDEFDNTSADTAEGYVKTIERAQKRGWSKEHIGHHVVRNNHIYHCEQAGIVGSMGAVFSTITENVIHDINYRKLFGGAEMAGIKIHGAIDAIISKNHIYRSGNFGIWLDWMTQGTRVTQNLLHDNRAPDMFSEVNHGPYLVDNNIMLSPNSLLVNSQGGAYVHNLLAGSVRVLRHERRQTPYHTAHSTNVIGLAPNPSGDCRFYNNIFVGHNGLSPYDLAKLPVFMAGNIFVAGAKPSTHEEQPLVLPQANPGLKLTEKPDGSAWLETAFDDAWGEHDRQLVTTDLLGKAKTPNLPYEQSDGTPYRIDTDYFGNPRNAASPFPGPFSKPHREVEIRKVWPWTASR